jgi:AraC-like DNA-binding protein
VTWARLTQDRLRGRSEITTPSIRDERIIRPSRQVYAFPGGRGSRITQSAAKMLYLQKGQFRVADLADHCNLSTRQLQRQFQDMVGVSAKTLARSIRFEEVRKRLMFDPEQSLTKLPTNTGMPIRPTSFATSRSSRTALPASSPARCGPSGPFSATATMSFFYNPVGQGAARLAAQSN